MSATYPRQLRAKEIDLLESVLPVERSGYREYRDLLKHMLVLGEGRRGSGNLVLGFAGDTPDITSPLAPVVAYGVIETTLDQFSITVREYVGSQIDVEIVSNQGEEIPDHFEEKRRWTYSTWEPGHASPATGTPVRQVAIDDNVTLAIAREEKRLWVHDRRTGMVLLIPITNFYNELMIHKSIRDPRVALHSSRFFSDTENYSDEDICMAFHSYNKLKPKVTLAHPPVVAKRTGWLHGLRRLLVPKK
ncbi:MAG: hypothetical protein ACKVRP_10300 [Bacteroidota bacterium]